MLIVWGWRVFEWPKLKERRGVAGHSRRRQRATDVNEQQVRFKEPASYYKQCPDCIVQKDYRGYHKRGHAHQFVKLEKCVSIGSLFRYAGDVIPFSVRESNKAGAMCLILPVYGWVYVTSRVFQDWNLYSEIGVAALPREVKW